MLVSAYMQILDMTKTASIVIVVVLIFRLLLKKLPKVISYAMWAVVLFRLLCPLSIEVPLSVMPEITPEEEYYTLADVPITPSAAAGAAYRAVGDALNGGLGLQHIHTELSTEDEEAASLVSFMWWETWILFGQYVWLAGIISMAIYAVGSYARLRRKLVTASPLIDNIWCADEITSPFVLGLIKPKIYIPSSISEQEQSYIILHEQHHIRRLDHIVKALAFAALCIHWFNPLVWVAFVMAGKDMEMSCDEAVVKQMGEAVLADYTASLLSLATGKHIIAGMPLAFGEGDTKGRIRNLASWKKPALWVILAAVIACIVLSVCLLTDPFPSSTVTPETPAAGQYGVVEVTFERPGTSFSMVAQNNTPSYIITDDMSLYSNGEHSGDGEWTKLGSLDELTLEKKNFDDLFSASNNGWFLRESAATIRKNNVRAWQLVYNEGILYYLLQQKNGELYLAYGYYDNSEKDDQYSDDTNIRWLYKLALEENKASGEVQEWFDYSQDWEAIQNSKTEVEQAAFPGVTFRYEKYKIIAENEAGSTILIEGMPVWNAYFADLTGDGLPEICASVSSGSGIVDDRVIIFDYANGISYSLEERMVYDFSLSVQQGMLIVTKRAFNTGKNGEIIEIGYPIYIGDSFEIIPFKVDRAELVTGVSYVSYQCIYMNPLSSYSAVGGNSGCIYTVGEDYFETLHRESGAQNLTSVQSWDWEPFPYTDEEWAALYIPSMTAISNISERYDNIEYLFLTAGKFLLRVDGDIWLVELASNPQMGTYLWSIYSLVPESTMGSAQWMYDPKLSSYSSKYFKFDFDMTYSEVSAVCTDSMLINVDREIRSNDGSTSLFYEGGSSLCWSPYNKNGDLVNKATVHFTVHTVSGRQYNGTLYINCTEENTDLPVYTATLVGTSLQLTQNAENGGGTITLGYN